jgi:hypothetical protein
MILGADFPNTPYRQVSVQGVIMASDTTFGAGRLCVPAISELVGGVTSMPPRVVSGRVQLIPIDPLPWQVVSGQTRPIADRPTWQSGDAAHLSGLRFWGQRAADPEPIIPDTDVALTATQMAEAFDRLGAPTTQEDVELSIDPDDYPFF